MKNYFKLKKFSISLLCITSIFCSISVLFFSKSRDGNLVVVFGLAVLIYVPALATYLFDVDNKFKQLGMNQADRNEVNLLQNIHSMSVINSGSLLFAITIQILIAVSFFFFFFN